MAMVDSMGSSPKSIGVFSFAGGLGTNPVSVGVGGLQIGTTSDAGASADQPPKVAAAPARARPEALRAPVCESAKANPPPPVQPFTVKALSSQLLLVSRSSSLE